MLLYINDSDGCRLNIVLSIHHKNVSFVSKDVCVCMNILFLWILRMIINKCKTWKKPYLEKFLRIVDFMNVMIKISQLNPKKET